jgi:hypothetical protein
MCLVKGVVALRAATESLGVDHDRETRFLIL